MVWVLTCLEQMEWHSWLLDGFLDFCAAQPRSSVQLCMTEVLWSKTSGLPFHILYVVPLGLGKGEPSQSQSPQLKELQSLWWPFALLRPFWNSSYFFILWPLMAWGRRRASRLHFTLYYLIFGTQTQARGGFTLLSFNSGLSDISLGSLESTRGKLIRALHSMKAWLAKFCFFCFHCSCHFSPTDATWKSWRPLTKVFSSSLIR